MSEKVTTVTATGSNDHFENMKETFREGWNEYALAGHPQLSIDKNRNEIGETSSVGTRYADVMSLEQNYEGGNRTRGTGEQAVRASHVSPEGNRFSTETVKGPDGKVATKTWVEFTDTSGEKRKMELASKKVSQRVGKMALGGLAQRASGFSKSKEKSLN